MPRALQSSGRVAKPIHTLEHDESARPAAARQARFVAYVNGLQGQASAARDAAHYGARRAVSGPRIYRDFQQFLRDGVEVLDARLDEYALEHDATARRRRERARRRLASQGQ